MFYSNFGLPIKVVLFEKSLGESCGVLKSDDISLLGFQVLLNCFC